MDKTINQRVDELEIAVTNLTGLIADMEVRMLELKKPVLKIRYRNKKSAQLATEAHKRAMKKYHAKLKEKKIGEKEDPVLDIGS